MSEQAKGTILHRAPGSILHTDNSESGSPGVGEAQKRLDHLTALAAEAGQALRDLASSIPTPSEFEKQEQALSFAHDNLATTTHHKPSKETFRKLARDRFGWTDAQFDAFVAAREGWMP